MMKTSGKPSKKCLFVFLTVLFCFAAGQAGAMAAEKAPDKIKLGCDNSLTGPLSVGGGWLQRGYDLAVRHINETGGVYVKAFDRKIPMEIVYTDNESDPKKTAARMEKLFSMDKIDFYLGGYTAFILVQQMAIAEKNKVPMLITTNGSMAEFEKGYRYIFTPFQTFKDQVTSFFDTLDSIPKDKRPSKIAYFQIQEEWGITSGKIMKEMAKERGYQLVTLEEYATGSNDFSSLIVKAKNDGAEVLYSCPFPPQGIRMIKQMKELKWAPKLTCLLRAADTGLWIKNLEQDGNYVCHTGGWDYHLKLPGIERLNNEYKAAFNTMPEPPVGTAYACIQILANGIENAGSLDREKVREAVSKSKTMTVAGEIVFQPNGRSISKAQQTMAQWQNGVDQLVWPKDQASAALMYPAPPWEQR
jgi:branched-chain amino acid transport system substrate-binding protein